MIKKSLIIISLLFTFLFNIGAAEQYVSHPVVFYGGPNTRIFGFSENIVDSVLSPVTQIGDSVTSESGTKYIQNGTNGEVSFKVHDDYTASVDFYFYWKLFTPEPTTIKITNITPLRNADSSGTEIHWKNDFNINGKEVSTKTFNSADPIVIYPGERLSKPFASCQEFKLKIDADSIKSLKDGIYTGSMVIEVSGI